MSCQTNKTLSLFRLGWALLPLILCDEHVVTEMPRVGGFTHYLKLIVTDLEGMKEIKKALHLPTWIIT